MRGVDGRADCVTVARPGVRGTLTSLVPQGSLRTRAVRARADTAQNVKAELGQCANSAFVF